MTKILLIQTFLKLETFLKALFFHIQAGLPKCSLDQIKSRYLICSECDRFDRVASTCKECGCNVGLKSQFFNKLAWADQECPLLKWSKLNVNKKNS